MKKITSNLLTLFVIMTIGFSFSACEKEQPNQLSGFYLTEAWDWDGVHKHCKALNFVNKNTVKVYNTVINCPHWNDEWGNYSSSLGIGYWYIQEGSDVRATYSIVENKVYIPNEGMILTMEGDKLYPDGSGYPYIKYSEANTSNKVSMKGQSLKFIRTKGYSYQSITNICIFEFTDDVACSFHVQNVWYSGPYFDDRLRPDGYYTKEEDETIWYGSYTCSGDKIEFEDEYGHKETLTKVNGKWQWKDNEDYELQ